MNWNYLIIGAIVAAGSATIAIYRKSKTGKMNFSDYCSSCERYVTPELFESEEVAKTILVLAKVDNDRVAPFLYRSYKDGKIRKKRIEHKTYPFSLCPENVQDSIIKGEYIIKRY